MLKMNAMQYQAAMFSLFPIKTPPTEGTWTWHQKALRYDSMTRNPANFLQWPTVQATLLANNVPGIVQEWSALAKDREAERWIDAIQEHDFGAPTRLEYLPASSATLVHQAYHLLQWERTTHRCLNDLHKVVEFGGGYGALCKVAQQGGYMGRWISYELWEMLLLQQLYLTNLDLDEEVELRPMQYLERPGGKKALTGWYYDAHEPDVDLLIALYSLDEVDVTIRDNFFDTLQPEAVWLAHADAYRDDHDLAATFHDFAQARPQYQWQFIPNACQPGHYYASGELDGRN